MNLRKIMLQMAVVVLIAASVFLGTEKYSYANTTVDNTLVKDNQKLIDELKNGQEQSTSIILLENNEKLDQLIAAHSLTLDSILDSLKVSPIDKKVYTNKEIEMMAKMVYGEARGETLKGQVAVAAVILNRVESPKFPDTVSNVLFQDGAFTAVNDGQFQKSPDHEAYQAVILAINGMDPTKNAIFYYNPEIAKSDWIYTRPTTAKIGEHVFAK